MAMALLKPHETMFRTCRHVPRAAGRAVDFPATFYISRYLKLPADQPLG